MVILICLEFYAMSMTYYMVILRVLMQTSENRSGNTGNMLNANTLVLLFH